MEYYRSSVNGSVFAHTGRDLNGDIWEPVIVITVARWRRLVEFFNGWVPTCKCDGRCEACDEDREIKAIIDSVEAPE
jgi:hypothetical protein